MKKDIDEITKIFKELFDSRPDLKEQMNKDKQWRQEREKLHISNGMSENDAKMNSWADYWNMVKDRDGVEFGINKLS
jgi:hypothetical protein